MTGFIQHSPALARRHRLARGAIALAALLGSSACTTLGGNVSGDFACRAPGGTCAPMSAIDAGAVESVIEMSSTPANRLAAAPAHRVGAGYSAGAATRTGERTLRIVFPAYVDAAGVLHDEAIAHAVVEGSAWAFAPAATADADAPTVFEISRSPAPSSLREAIAGASAPAIEGLGSLPAQAPHPIIGIDDPRLPVVLPGPTPDALAAARAGHRIARPGIVQPDHGAVGQPGRRTGIPSQHSAAEAAAARVREMAAPSLSILGGARPDESDLENVFTSEPGTKDAPQ